MKGASVNLNEITVLIPCHNEEIFIRDVIKDLRVLGFSNIVVLDDASTDRTYQEASSNGVEIMRSSNLLGFSTTLLKGLYEVETPYALIYSASELLNNDSDLIEFIEFGASGEYAMLISKEQENGVSRNLSHFLKKKFGIFIPEPGFDFVFLNSDLIKIIKAKVATTNTNIYFEIIRQAISNDLKIGVYPIKILDLLSYSPNRFRVKLKRFIRFRKYESVSYFDYVFPDIERKRLLGQIMTGFIGYILIKAFELLVTYIANGWD